jgi:hypothetical protein
MSAYHSKADIPQCDQDVGDGPKAGMSAGVECTFRQSSHLTKVVGVARGDQDAA